MTDLLFDVPIQPRRIDAFKTRHQIQTHYSRYSEMPWCAAHMPTVWKEFAGYDVLPTDGLGECAAKVCRLMDESGIMGYGKTEADAIIEACKAAGVTVLPNDL